MRLEKRTPPAYTVMWMGPGQAQRPARRNGCRHVTIKPFLECRAALRVFGKMRHGGQMPYKLSHVLELKALLPPNVFMVYIFFPQF